MNSETSFITEKTRAVYCATLRAANELRNSERDPDEKITPSFRGCELGGEAGEALNVIKKLEREKLGLSGSRSTVEKLADELADVIICADLIAMDYGIDLIEAIKKKFNATSEELGLKTLFAGNSL